MDSLDELNQILIACRLCPRLVAWREQVAIEKRRAYRDWDYWGKPVPGFGDPAARLLVVGLAPGAHGSNRTGRMFTGDASGDFLYPALHRAGFASQPFSKHREDKLALNDLFISAVCRCAPPDNRPSRVEIANCLPYLRQELALLTRLQVIVVLGRIAFEAIVGLYADDSRKIDLDRRKLHFIHGAMYKLGDQAPALVVSYHPSRQNTQTGRLTPAMFDTVWTVARSLLH
jgi:uracil-DNA glycosylase family 4